ncbi:nitronate monooxygenase [Aquabacterium sp. A7-Y]|uniref:NAD(P)H-dependent flavin oxidoreductase n=1 Tax=Aquabacterium sp. A7-Y TaxID=1349605 RepID=UPI00223DDA42|nr:nitronate monooxygenase [Aquabacterium sp. A7-Y]MCW7538343.1 nitronate monooxygenase [Aquabacterium sp. A7-Y]
MNPLIERLGIRHPVMLAPMGGEAASAALVAAVSQAGGLGILGAAYMTPARIVEAIAEIRALTDRPFGVNLFCPQAWQRDEARLAAFIEALSVYHQELGLPPPQVPQRFEESFEEQFEAVLSADVPLFSYTFGDLGSTLTRALQARDTLVVGTATQVREARQLEAGGADAVVAQGAEAGAHRGSFLGTRDEGLVGTLALVPQVVDAVHIPVIAAGGIADPRGVRAAQALGASAAAVGTAFLLADECPISAAYKAALSEAADSDTALTRAFSGRWARGIENRFMREMAPLALPDFPIPNALTRPLRQAAGKAGAAQFLSLWAGQAVPLARPMPAAQLVATLASGWQAG